MHTIPENYRVALYKQHINLIEKILGPLLKTCGDFDLQAYDYFDLFCRRVLNEINKIHQQVISICCVKVQIGAIQLDAPQIGDGAESSQFWIDFNMGAKSIYIMYDSSSFGNEDGSWASLSIPNDIVTEIYSKKWRKYNHSEEYGKSLLIFTNGSLEMNENQHLFRESHPVIFIRFNQTEQYEYLEKNILKQMFGNRFKNNLFNSSAAKKSPEKLILDNSKMNHSRIIQFTDNDQQYLPIKTDNKIDPPIISLNTKSYQKSIFNLSSIESNSNINSSTTSEKKYQQKSVFNQAMEPNSPIKLIPDKLQTTKLIPAKLIQSKDNESNKSDVSLKSNSRTTSDTKYQPKSVFNQAMDPNSPKKLIPDKLQRTKLIPSNPIQDNYPNKLDLSLIDSNSQIDPPKTSKTKIAPVQLMPDKLKTTKSISSKLFQNENNESNKLILSSQDGIFDKTSVRNSPTIESLKTFKANRSQNIQFEKREPNDLSPIEPTSKTSSNKTVFDYKMAHKSSSKSIDKFNIPKPTQIEQNVATNDSSLKVDTQKSTLSGSSQLSIFNCGGKKNSPTRMNNSQMMFDFTFSEDIVIRPVLYFSEQDQINIEDSMNKLDVSYQYLVDSLSESSQGDQEESENHFDKKIKKKEKLSYYPKMKNTEEETLETELSMGRSTQKEVSNCATESSKSVSEELSLKTFANSSLNLGSQSLSQSTSDLKFVAIFKSTPSDEHNVESNIEPVSETSSLETVCNSLTNNVRRQSLSQNTSDKKAVEVFKSIPSDQHNVESNFEPVSEISSLETVCNPLTNNVRRQSLSQNTSNKKDIAAFKSTPSDQHNVESNFEPVSEISSLETIRSSSIKNVRRQSLDQNISHKEAFAVFKDITSNQHNVESNFEPVSEISSLETVRRSPIKNLNRQSLDQNISHKKAFAVFKDIPSNQHNVESNCETVSEIFSLETVRNSTIKNLNRQSLDQNVSDKKAVAAFKCTPSDEHNVESNFEPASEIFSLETVRNSPIKNLNRQSLSQNISHKKAFALIKSIPSDQHNFESNCETVSEISSLETVRSSPIKNVRHQSLDQNTPHKKAFAVLKDIPSDEHNVESNFEPASEIFSLETVRNSPIKNLRRQSLSQNTSDKKAFAVFKDIPSDQHNVESNCETVSEIFSLETVRSSPIKNLNRQSISQNISDEKAFAVFKSTPSDKSNQFNKNIDHDPNYIKILDDSNQLNNKHHNQSDPEVLNDKIDLPDRLNINNQNLDHNQNDLEILDNILVDELNQKNQNITQDLIHNQNDLETINDVIDIPNKNHQNVSENLDNEINTEQNGILDTLNDTQNNSSKVDCDRSDRSILNIQKTSNPYLDFISNRKIGSDSSVKQNEQSTPQTSTKIVSKIKVKKLQDMIYADNKKSENRLRLDNTLHETTADKLWNEFMDNNTTRNITPRKRRLFSKDTFNDDCNDSFKSFSQDESEQIKQSYCELLKRNNEKSIQSTPKYQKPSIPKVKRLGFDKKITFSYRRNSLFRNYQTIEKEKDEIYNIKYIIDVTPITPRFINPGRPAPSE
ncbi:uncharacterized protein PF11_0213-like [Chrysoperla carnea]|uniref:uncharacterized protein PF11_0213-like n=1 Tax=Chrysoperla carnea TaxID=189513 RepID=UPI001D06A93C|nr:uncharacterized protein PF11_0213-like [Chrysoperla carnea]